MKKFNIVKKFNIGCAVVLISILIITFLVFVIGDFLFEHSRLAYNNSLFVKLLYKQFVENDTCALEYVLPIVWDRVIVFQPYTSREHKYEIAGYPYDKNIRTREYEGYFSMLFMNDDEVVFYVEFALEQCVIQYKEDQVVGLEYRNHTTNEKPFAVGFRIDLQATPDRHYYQQAYINWFVFSS